MIKSKFMLLATTGLLTLCALGFTSCSNPSNTQDSASHTEHTYGDWETVKAPTCTEKGQKKRKCTGCDKEETAEIDAKGHSFAAEWEIDKDNHWHKATCGHDTEKSALGAHADSDSDGKCDVCSFDMTADWPEPKFVFDQDPDGTQFNPLSVRYPRQCEPIDRSVPVVIPDISSDGTIKFFDKRNVGWKWEQIKTESDYIAFNDPEINGNDECYIFYDKLKAACYEAHVKMDKEQFYKLFDAIFTIAYPDL